MKQKPKQKLEKYSERFDNKENELVQGVFNPDNWGRRLVKEEPKQETLEEAAEIFVKNRFTKQICNDESYPDIYASKAAIVESHILFAKWQQKISYSEEDMIAFGEFIFKNTLLAHAKGVKSLFEQFKKK